MGLFERLLGRLLVKPAAGAGAPAAARPPRPDSPLVAPPGAGPPRLPRSDVDSDDDSDDGDVFSPPKGSIATLSAPLCAPRRGALDMGNDSMSDSGCARASGAGGRGASPGGSELDSLYSDVTLIHRGRHAMIYRGRERRSRRRIVLKAYPRAQRNPTRAAALEREQDMLRAAGGHPGIVAMERVLEAPDATYLVLEAGTGGTLIEAVANNGGRLPERVAARRVVAPLLRALAHLHSRGIVHRDLKPEHILLSPDGPRITDFAVAARLPSAPAALAPIPEDVRKRSAELRRSVEAFHARHRRSGSGGSAAAAAREPSPQGQAEHHQKQQPQVAAGVDPRQRDVLNHRTGTLEYSAPEMLSKPTAAEVFHLVLGQGMDEEELPTYDEKVDVWAVGAVTFEALTGRQPFLADGAAEMAGLVAARLAARDGATGVPAFIAGVAGLSAECRDFLTRCFEAAPLARPAAAELLAHPWLHESDDGGVHWAQAAAAADSGLVRHLRRSLSASTTDLDLTRPRRTATGRLETQSRVAAVAAVGTA
ncbi:hypothetical protein Rsub_02817 [Raphidocelis subcapitata]|uniref:Protein kinase domain-containing protein n=1 Tax=Raphidocelis subcapitata TaxID=307507 RepID=A0A2V0NS05_9CHLO|nr:hypothetical protein Rsub_02817 [Raphidocelis subcapitata]|eukprot:GBF90109.1 hypothetical protein Rsub_02817 [Raphidocelis subcapitata]